MYTEPCTLEVPAQPVAPLPAWAVPVVEVALPDDLSLSYDLDIEVAAATA